MAWNVKLLLRIQKDYTNDLDYLRVAVLTRKSDLIISIIVYLDLKVNIVVPHGLGWLSIWELILQHVIIKQRNLLILEELEG